MQRLKSQFTGNQYNQYYEGFYNEVNLPWSKHFRQKNVTLLVFYAIKLYTFV